MRADLMAAMANILRQMLGRTIRAEGLLSLMAENCKACGKHNELRWIKIELDALVIMVNDLIEVFEKGVRK